MGRALLKQVIDYQDQLQIHKISPLLDFLKYEKVLNQLSNNAMMPVSINIRLKYVEST